MDPRPRRRPYSRHYAEGATQAEIRALYSERASDPSVSEDALRGEFGDPKYFAEERGDVVASGPASRYWDFVDDLGRRYTMQDPSPSMLKKSGPDDLLYIDLIVRMRYALPRGANSNARLAVASEERVDMLLAMAEATHGRTGYVLRNMTALVIANTSNPVLVTGVLDARIVRFDSD